MSETTKARRGWRERIYRCLRCGHETVCFAKDDDGHEVCWMCQDALRQAQPGEARITAVVVG